MNHPIRTLLNCAFASLLLTTSVFAADAKPAGVPELLSVKKIWDAGGHNAFTDLLWFKDQFYCTFRESSAHVGGNGKLRVLTSPNGETWTSVALLTEEGVDLRDPKLSITPDGRLMMLAGGSIYDGTTLKGRQSRAAFSSDGGKTWTPTARILAEGDWLWRVTWHKGKAYGIAYRATDKKNDVPWDVTLYSTADGLKYDRVAALEVPDRPNEATVRFTEDDTMIAMVRREAGNKSAWAGSAVAPYTTWKWNELPHSVGGPNFVILPDGKMWAAGRQTKEKKATTVLARFALPNTYEPLLTFPSGGDCSYPGFVLQGDTLFMSYYSTHEGKTNIYFAKVKLPAGH